MKKNSKICPSCFILYIIDKIAVDQGPSLKRFIPWSRGVARPVKKRMAHLTVVLTDKGGIKKEIGGVKEDTSKKEEINKEENSDKKEIEQNNKE